MEDDVSPLDVRSDLQLDQITLNEFDGGPGGLVPGPGGWGGPVDAEHRVPGGGQRLDEMGADESGRPGDHETATSGQRPSGCFPIALHGPPKAGRSPGRSHDPAVAKTQLRPWWPSKTF